MVVHERGAEGDHPELAKLRAFAEHSFASWLARLPKDFFANKMGKLAVRSHRVGANVPSTAAMASQFCVLIAPEQVLVGVVAPEEVTSCRFDPVC